MVVFWWCDFFFWGGGLANLTSLGLGPPLVGMHVVTCSKAFSAQASVCVCFFFEGAP